MIEVSGKFNTAKIYTDVVDEASIAQVQELCNQEYASGSRIRLMPGIHAGAGCTIGTTMTIKDKICQNLVGVDIENMILRKGAVSAKDGEQLLTPINMRDGSLICIGKGNEDWNCSAPHGAGRLMSRAQAKKSFTVEEFEQQMAGVYTTSVDASTLDECPMAYKGMDDIVKKIGPTAEVVNVIKPIYNFKAGA